MREKRNSKSSSLSSPAKKARVLDLEPSLFSVRLETLLHRPVRLCSILRCCCSRRPVWRPDSRYAGSAAGGCPPPLTLVVRHRWRQRPLTFPLHADYRGRAVPVALVAVAVVLADRGVPPSAVHTAAVAMMMMMMMMMMSRFL